MFGSLSCAEKKDGETTFVSFVSSDMIEKTEFSSGAFVYGARVGGPERFGIELHSPIDRLELARGTWDFWAVVWEGATSMVGPNRCGHTIVKLTSDIADIEMNLSSTQCPALEFFGGTSAWYSGDTVFKKVNLYVCENAQYFSNASCTSCDTPNGLPYKSYKVIMHGYRNIGLVRDGDPLVSECLVAGSNQQSTEVSVPIGRKITYFDGIVNNIPVSIIGYKDSDKCEGSSVPYDFSVSLNNNPFNAAVSLRDACVDASADTATRIQLRRY